MLRDLIRSEHSGMPDGVYGHVVKADGVDAVMTCPIRLTVLGDEVSVDFDGAPSQIECDGSNCTLNYTKAHVTYPLKCILTPDIPGNAGCCRPMSVRSPAGCRAAHMDAHSRANQDTLDFWRGDVLGVLASRGIDMMALCSGERP